MKKRRPQTITLGLPRTNLTFERRKANDKKMNGKNIEDQEKYLIKNSLNFRSIAPWREKETIISPAMIKNIILEIENADSFLSFNLNDLFVNLFLFFTIVNHCISKFVSSSIT